MVCVCVHMHLHGFAPAQFCACMHDFVRVNFPWGYTRHADISPSLVAAHGAMSLGISTGDFIDVIHLLLSSSGRRKWRRRPHGPLCRCLHSNIPINRAAAKRSRWNAIAAVRRFPRSPVHRQAAQLRRSERAMVLDLTGNLRQSKSRLATVPAVSGAKAHRQLRPF